MVRFFETPSTGFSFLTPFMGKFGRRCLKNYIPRRRMRDVYRYIYFRIEGLSFKTDQYQFNTFAPHLITNSKV